jgi:glycosyltransferase involved in cell wall biosynthesis
VDFSLVSLLTLWRRPKIVVLDLRPLQCGYAGKGIGRYTMELARRLAERADASEKKRRFQVHSLVMEGRDNPLPQIPVLITAPVWKRPWLWDQVCLPFLLVRRRVFVFHNFTTLGPLPQVSFPVLSGLRGIATVHDWHMFAEGASELEKFYRRTLRIRIQKKFLPRVRRIVVDAEQIKVDSMLQGLGADRISVVRLGSDHLDAIPTEPWHKENFVLSVGDTPNKGLRFVHEILSLLRSRFVHLNWVIVGSRERILDQLGLIEGKLPDWMTILDSPSDGLLKSCYQKALVLLFPSTREGFGIPVLEAMRFGCPVLASDLEPLSSLVNHPPSLLPVDDREAWCAALSKLLYDPDIRRAAAEAGKGRSAEFTWDKAVDELLKLYPV